MNKISCFVGKTLATLILLLSIVATTSAQSWNSLNAKPYPQWFSDAKLGIFVHWGLYSVPAYASKEGYAEWFYRGLMANDSGRCRIMSLYADTTLPVFEQYRELAKHWHGELWQPRQWADIFCKAGAKYVVLVTKHHDGYCLWDSPQQPHWNSVVSGPKRNIVEELTSAVRDRGMRMGFYYSLPEWSNPLHVWMQDPDKNISAYVDTYMIPQFKDLISRYKPSLIFADGDWQNTAEQFHSVELIDWYYKTVGDEAIVNDRWGIGTKHGFKTPEYSAGISDTTRPWAECRGIGRSFGLNRNEDPANYISERELIQHFCELVAHGGGLTLNVGPAADGTIPPIQQERLLALGQWLETNGKAIYGSRPWTTTCHREHFSTTLPDAEKIDYDWVRNAPLKGMPVDNFRIHWHGTVEVPQDGNYSIRIFGNDEVSLAWNGDTNFLYFNNTWADNSASEKTVHLKKGLEDFKVNFTEKDLEASVKLEWRKENDNDYRPMSATWHGVAQWDQTVRCFTRNNGNIYAIEFERPHQSISIPAMPRLNRQHTKVKLLGTSPALKWKQKRNGTLIIDLSPVCHEEMDNLNHAWVFEISTN